MRVPCRLAKTDGFVSIIFQAMSVGCRHALRLYLWLSLLLPDSVRFFKRYHGIANSLLMLHILVIFSTLVYVFNLCTQSQRILGATLEPNLNVFLERVQRIFEPLPCFGILYIVLVTTLCNGCHLAYGLITSFN